MFRLSLCLFFAMLVSCSTPPRPASTSADQALGLDKGPGPSSEDATRLPVSEEELKLCMLAAGAQTRSAEEVADCLRARGEPLQRRLQMAQAAAQKADEARQCTDGRCPKVPNRHFGQNDDGQYNCTAAPSVRNDVLLDSNSYYYRIGRFQDSQGNVYHHIRVNCDHFFCAVDAECLKRGDDEDNCLRTTSCCVAHKVNEVDQATLNGWGAGLLKAIEQNKQK